ncbi:MAG: hypothetical protein AB7F79_00950 [Steroidobacteraceae bacterium]
MAIISKNLPRDTTALAKLIVDIAINQEAELEPKEAKPLRPKSPKPSGALKSSSHPIS